MASTVYETDSCSAIGEAMVSKLLTDPGACFDECVVFLFYFTVILSEFGIALHGLIVFYTFLTKSFDHFQCHVMLKEFG